MPLYIAALGAEVTLPQDGGWRTVGTRSRVQKPAPPRITIQEIFDSSSFNPEVATKIEPSQEKLHKLAMDLPTVFSEFYSLSSIVARNATPQALIVLKQIVFRSSVIS